MVLVLASALTAGALRSRRFGTTSPTWGGFSFKASYGANRLTAPNGLTTFADDFDFADVAVFYANDWGNWKVSAAYAYTWIESAVTTGSEADLHQAGGTIMHTPTGLGVYGMGQWEQTSGAPDTQAYGVKPFWKASISPLGATVFYGEWARYEDQFGGLVGVDLCGVGGCFVTGSEVERYGLGVVQEIDAAAMHVFARWQHQELDVNITNTTADFEDWDLFQAGGIIFF